MSSRLKALAIILPTVLVSFLGFSSSARADELELRRDESGTELLLNQQPIHRTAQEVRGARLLEVPGTSTRIALWRERSSLESERSFYAISLDGKRVDTVKQTSYDLLLRHGRFDPAAAAAGLAPGLAPELAATAGRLFIVQFISQPLEAFRAALEELGVKVHYYLAHHSFIVEMPAALKNHVEAFPAVRWVGPYHPAYKLEEGLIETVTGSPQSSPIQRYQLQITGGAAAAKERVADRVRALGGVVEGLRPGSPILEASVSPAALRELITMDEVFFVDRWLPMQTYMDNVRIDGGAEDIEAAGGYTGAGVRGEVMDTGLLTTHGDWAQTPIIHSANGGNTGHGTAVFGIVFGDGSGDAAGRGLLPDGQGIFSVSSFNDRAGHIAELVAAPYFAVFQTNSWGACCTTSYGTESMEIDQIIFDNDIVILQAQANQGSRDSDVSAWAKNNVSVGGIRHFDSLSRDDDAWSNAGSIGPAADGRVKPDLSYWYDSIFTTSNSGGYTSSFGGTSAATPTTAGHFGLMFEMWNDGIFGNAVDALGTVFDNRPHAMTAKALLVNAANPYDFSGAAHDLTRVHQGWGVANVSTLYNARDRLFVINETDVLTNLGSTTYTLTVEAGTPSLRATLAYMDPAGTTSSSQHRINDLTLEVTSPSAVTYFGNNGLLDGNQSTPGGTPNTIDTVENVWIDSPEAGVWSVTVRADEINQDGHVETAGIDADYALVVRGVISSSIFSDGFESGDTSVWAMASP